MTDLEKKEQELLNRLQRIQNLEAEIEAKESALKKQEREKKQVLLRLAPSLWSEVAAWAAEDLRSINGQIEFILKGAVAKHRGQKPWD